MGIYDILLLLPKEHRDLLFMDDFRLGMTCVKLLFIISLYTGCSP